MMFPVALYTTLFHIEEISFYSYFLECLYHEIALDFDYSFFCNN